MAEFPAMPLWTDAYLADTTHLTTLEHGAYMLLLMCAWRSDGKLPNDDKMLARFARLTSGQWQRIRPTIIQFFTVDGEWLVQGRLTDELNYVRRKSKTQSENAKGRHQPDFNGLKTKLSDGDTLSRQTQKSELSDSLSPNTLENNTAGSAMAEPNASQLDAPTPTPTPNESSSYEDDSSVMPRENPSDLFDSTIPDKSNKRQSPKASNKTISRKKQLTDVWVPPESDIAWARQEGFTDTEIRGETQKFLNHALAHERTFAQPGRAWRNWLINSRKFNHSNKGGTYRRRESIVEHALRAGGRDPPEPERSQPTVIDITPNWSGNR